MNESRAEVRTYSDEYIQQKKPTRFLTIDDFIWVKDGVLSPEFCNNCIEKFDRSDELIDGHVGAGIAKQIKDTKDLMVSASDEWRREDEVFKNSLQECVMQYVEHMDAISNGFELCNNEYYDTGYQIQRYEPDAGYKWHNDDNLPQGQEQRCFTFIWYLNTVEVDGYTQFVSGTRVRAKQGRLVIFPSSWTYLHRGYPPKNQRKYICTGWLHAHG